MAYSTSKKRVVKNTAFLYIRTLIMLVIGVFTSRITLQALGVDDYGIINVVGGFVGMFSLISGSLTTACQRFLTYEMERADCNIRSVFSATLYIHFALSAIVLLLAETVGLYFIYNCLNLPQERYAAIFWVYQCSIISFILTLINVPFNALIVAHEKMDVYAYLSMLEVVLKLIVVILLLYAPTDKLILYAVLGLISSIILRITFQTYCHRKFGKDIKLKKNFDRKLIKEIFGFAGWSFVGNTAFIASNQGVNMIINIFCGVVVNAARGIAVMVENVIFSFVSNFTTAINPQITKAYATAQYDQLQDMTLLGLKVTFYLMLIMATPITISAPELLQIWFTTVPNYTSAFVRITLISATIQAIGNPFMTMLFATGRIRNYQLFSGTLLFLNLPGSYVLLKHGFPPTSVYFLSVVIAAIIFSCRFIFIKRQTGLPIGKYILQLVYFIPILGICAITNVAIYWLLPIENIFQLALYGILTLIINLITIYFFGINHNERQQANTFIQQKLSMLFQKA